MNKTDDLIKDLCEESKEPVKCVSCAFTRTATILGIVALSIFLLMPLLGGMRPDIAEKIQNSRFIVEMLALLAAGTFAVLACFQLSIPDDRPRKKEYAIAAIAIAIWGLLAGSILWANTMEDLAAQLQSTRPGMYCARNVILFGAIPALALIYMLRKAAPTHFKLVGFLAILGAFSFGVVGCRLHYGDIPTYILIWQYAPAFIAALLIVLFSEKILRW